MVNNLPKKGQIVKIQVTSIMSSFEAPRGTSFSSLSYNIHLTNLNFDRKYIELQHEFLKQKLMLQQ